MQKINVRLNDEEYTALIEIKKFKKYMDSTNSKIIRNIIHDYYIVCFDTKEQRHEKNLLYSILNEIKDVKTYCIDIKNESKEKDIESKTDEEVLKMSKGVLDGYINLNEISDRQIAMWYKKYMKRDN